MLFTNALHRFFFVQFTLYRVIIFLGEKTNGGPSPEELLHLLEQCDLSNSLCSTPCMSPSPSLAAAVRLKSSNVAFLNQLQDSDKSSSSTWVLSFLMWYRLFYCSTVNIIVVGLGCMLLKNEISWLCKCSDWNNSCFKIKIFVLVLITNLNILGELLIDW